MTLRSELVQCKSSVHDSLSDARCTSWLCLHPVTSLAVRGLQLGYFFYAIYCMQGPFPIPIHRHQQSTVTLEFVKPRIHC